MGRLSLVVASEWTSPCGGLSYCRAWALGHMGSTPPWHVRSSWVRDGPVSPLAGGFFTPGPPEKPQEIFFRIRQRCHFCFLVQLPVALPHPEGRRIAALAWLSSTSPYTCRVPMSVPCPQLCPGHHLCPRLSVSTSPSLALSCVLTPAVPHPRL